MGRRLSILVPSWGLGVGVGSLGQECLLRLGIPPPTLALPFKVHYILWFGAKSQAPRVPPLPPLGGDLVSGGSRM